MRTTILFLFLLATLSVVQAQTGTISGKVTTSDGEPAEFVNIGIAGTTAGAATDSKGEFRIEGVEPGEYTIVISHVGLGRMEQRVIVRSGGTAIVEMRLAESALTLKEVVVSGERGRSYNEHMPSTGLRTITPLIENPQNIQVITRDVIADQQSFDALEGVVRNVSGAQKLEHWDNYARINMRGSQITAFRNGINVQMPWGPLAEDMSMVERIEFVKGPAGFMLSSGEPGGFYNIVTRKPTGIRRTEVGLSLGSFETYRATVDIDGRFRPESKLLYRINAMGQKKGSHRNMEFTDRWSIAPVLKYEVSDRTSITLEYTHQFAKMSAIGSNYAFSNRTMGDLPIGFTTAERNLDPSRINEQNVFFQFEHSFSKDWRLVAQGAYINYEMIGQSLWPAGFDPQNDSLMQRSISIWDALGMNRSAQVFVSGRKRTGKIDHTILAGADASFKDYYADWSQYALLGGADFNIYAPVYNTVSDQELPVWDRSIELRSRPGTVHYNNNYVAFYAQDELGFFNNKVRLTLAGRYTQLIEIDPYADDVESAKITPRVGLSWSVNKATSIYALRDESFLGNPGMDHQGRRFDPIEAENLELGLKRDWAGGRWNTVLAAYRITKNNVLTTDLEHADPVTGQFVFMRQTGQQQVQGIEFDLRGKLTNGLSLILNYAYTDAVITRDSDPSIVGNKVPGASEHIQNTWLNYRFGKGAIEGLGFSIGYQYQAGRSTWAVYNEANDPLPEYFRLDGAIGFQKERYRIDLIVNNVLDEYLYSGAPAYGMYYWQTEPGRNARITFTYEL